MYCFLSQRKGQTLARAYCSSCRSGEANLAPAPNRLPCFPLGSLVWFVYVFCAPPASPAAVGEAQRSATFAHMRQRLVQAIVGLVALAALAGCTSSRVIRSQSGTATNSISQPLRNGIYAVVEQATTNTLAQGEDAPHVVLVYDRRKYDEAPQNEPLTYVTLDQNAFVPLIIEGTPKVQKDDDGRSMLRFSLAHDQANALEDLTRAHLGGRVATVLDGEIITLSTIR